MKNVSGANFCFWVSLLVLCFLVGFCLCFCFMFWRVAPESVGKILLMSGLVFFGLVLSSFGFFVDVVFRRFFKRHRSGSNRTPPHAPVWFFFSLFVSRRAFCFALFGRASCFLAFFSGCHSGPRAFLGFSFNLWGLSSLAPSVALFLGREAARVFLCFSCLVFLFPLLFCFAATLSLEGPPRDLAEAGRG